MSVKCEYHLARSAENVGWSRPLLHAPPINYHVLLLKKSFYERTQGKAIILGCLFEAEGGEMVVTGGETVVTGGEVVVTGGETVVAPPPSGETVVAGGSSEEETGCRLVELDTSIIL